MAKRAERAADCRGYVILGMISATTLSYSWVVAPDSLQKEKESHVIRTPSYTANRFRARLCLPAFGMFTRCKLQSVNAHHYIRAHDSSDGTGPDCGGEFRNAVNRCRYRRPIDQRGG